LTFISFELILYASIPLSLPKVTKAPSVIVDFLPICHPYSINNGPFTEATRNHVLWAIIGLRLLPGSYRVPSFRFQVSFRFPSTALHHPAALYDRELPYCSCSLRFQFRNLYKSTNEYLHWRSDDRTTFRSLLSPDFFDSLL
jgi:hypothetical protein